MIRRLVLPAALGFAVLGALTMAWSVADPQPALALTNCDTSTAELDASEQEVVALFNQARAQQGLAPLKVSPSLSRAAAWKSADPSATGSGGVQFSHTDSLGRDPSTRARNCGYPGWAAENIAWGFSSAQSVFNAWMGSPGHRAAILGNYSVVGVGRVGSAWTAAFGTVDDSGSAGTAGVSTATPTPSPTPIPTPIPTPPPILRRLAVPMIASE